MTTKSITKSSAFGSITAQMSARIDDNEKAKRFEIAHFNFNTKIRQLDIDYETKAATIRAEFVAEIAEINGNNEEEE